MKCSRCRTYEAAPERRRCARCIADKQRRRAEARAAGLCGCGRPRDDKRYRDCRVCLDRVRINRARNKGRPLPLAPPMDRSEIARRGALAKNVKRPLSKEQARAMRATKTQLEMPCPRCHLRGPHQCLSFLEAASRRRAA